MTDIFCSCSRGVQRFVGFLFLILHLRCWLAGLGDSDHMECDYKVAMGFISGWTQIAEYGLVTTHYGLVNTDKFADYSIWITFRATDLKPHNWEHRNFSSLNAGQMVRSGFISTPAQNISKLLDLLKYSLLLQWHATVERDLVQWSEVWTGPLSVSGTQKVWNTQPCL